MKRLIAGILAVAALEAGAGGSNYGIAPGSREIAGKVSEWPVPTPRFARDPAPAPGRQHLHLGDERQQDRALRSEIETFKEWEMPDGARPHGLLVASDGNLLHRQRQRHDRRAGSRERQDHRALHAFERRRSAHAVIDAEGNIWFTVQSGGYLGKLDRRAARSPNPMPGGPYGLSLDKAGNIWFCRMGANTLGISTRRPARPRNCAPAPARGLAALRQRRTACCGSLSTATACSRRSIRRR